MSQIDYRQQSADLEVAVGILDAELNRMVAVLAPDRVEVARPYYSDQCAEAVVRKGEEEPCDKPAVALRRDPTEGGIYPVCSYHARADMVPLAVVLAGGVA